MNDLRLYFYAMEHEFLFIPDITRQHSIFILEAFRKVGRRRESHFIRYFRYALAGFLQQSLTLLQARFAQQVYGRKPCKSLHLSIQLHAAESDMLSDSLHTEV